MFSPHELSGLMGRIMHQLGMETGAPKEGSSPSNNQGNSLISGITPAEALVILGIITDVLNVNSILVSKDEHIEIVLIGSLKRKTELDRIMDKIGPRPFDEVLKAILDRVHE